MEQLKTLNNSYAKDFIRCLVDDNFRACSYMLYHCRYLFISDLYKRLCRYYFSRFPFNSSSAIREVCDIHNIACCVRSHIISLYYQWKGGVF